MMDLSRVVLALAALALSVVAQSTFSPARPPAIPLAVRSPYLSTWLDVGSDGGNGGYLAGEWPAFWTNLATGWAGMIRVDGVSYEWMGAIPGMAVVNQTSFEYTSTKSIFTMEVGGKVEMTVKFLSPITPNDLRRQSLTFSYLHVDVASLDGIPHDVQLYADISAEWVSGDRNNAIIEWDYGSNGGVAYHKLYRQTQMLFSEIDQQAEWGYWYWATDDLLDMTYQSGRNIEVRGTFTDKGTLQNSQDTNYRAISNNWPVFAYAIDLGSVESSPVSSLFSIGLAQTEAIQYASPSGIVPLQSLWTSYFPDDLAALEFFHHDYVGSELLSSQFDQMVEQDSNAAGGPEYLTITSLSVRQVFGATQIVGTITDSYLFMKEISSDGNVNTVDVIFPAHPLFLYTSPEYVRLLLEPLFEYQQSGQYPNEWAMHDIGFNYPNATGHPHGNDEKMPLEECGNMVIMALAYAVKADDIQYLHDHYSKLKQWTTYLVNDALYPANQISTDDFAGPLPNQTNLALKGMIGIKAMSVIAHLTGNHEDSLKYTNIAHQYIDQWETLGVAHDADPPHTTLSYGANKTHGLLYNLFADRELSLHLVPDWVYNMQSNFYPTVENRYGVPLDTRHDYTKGDWQMFTAAIAGSETQQMFIRDLATWIDQTPTNLALTDLYGTISGNYPPGLIFIARPVMGGSFALVLLKQGL